jgi:hypothetical protein
VYLDPPFQTLLFCICTKVNLQIFILIIEIFQTTTKAAIFFILAKRTYDGITDETIRGILAASVAGLSLGTAIIIIGLCLIFGKPHTVVSYESSCCFIGVRLLFHMCQAAVSLESSCCFMIDSYETTQLDSYEVTA